MPAYKDKNGKWFISATYTDWQGVHRRKVKRGFKTRREALEWEREFLLQGQGSLEMEFKTFYERYKKDLKGRIRTSTWVTKVSLFDRMILPYFKDKKMCDIKPADVIAWQNEMLAYRDEKGKPYSPVYLKTIHNQLSAIFNHAVRFYNLPYNPAAKVGSMGKEKTREMLFWTKEEYLKFSEAMMSKPVSYYAFEILYWCGLRVGELLALTVADCDFENQVLRINKSLQRIHQEDIITEPKTPKSIRNVEMPEFLSDEIHDYVNSIYGIGPDDRLFQITKHYLHHEMTRGCNETGVKRIRIHDLRHSHVSLLINRGATALEIADRVGHESIDITYRYAHLFPSSQKELARKLNLERGDIHVSKEQRQEKPLAQYNSRVSGLA